MLNEIKNMISKQVEFLEAASTIYEDTINTDLDDSIILGEEAEDDTSESDDINEDDPNTPIIDDTDDDEDKDNNNEDISNTDVEDDENDIDDNEDEPDNNTDDVLDSDIDGTSTEEPLPIPGDDDLPTPIGRQTGEPIDDDFSNILDTTIDIGSNTIRDILPIPPSNAIDALGGDEDILSQKIDSGFGGDTGTTGVSLDDNSNDILDEDMDSTDEESTDGDLEESFNDILDSDLEEIEETSLVLDNENTDLLEEKFDVEKAKQTMKELGTAASKKAKKILEHIREAVKYLKDSAIRLYNIMKDEKYQKEQKALQKIKGWSVDLDKIHGDEYEDEFEDSSVVAIESVLLEDGTTLTDKKGASSASANAQAFMKDVLKYKYILVPVLCKMVPGMTPAVAIAELTKAVTTLVPACTDLIATSKEVALLKEKYAGKVKVIKNDDGTSRTELPAEAYITIDKYKKCAERILAILAPIKGNDNRTYQLKIADTNDILSLACDLAEGTESTRALGQLYDNFCDKLVDCQATADGKLSVNFDLKKVRNIPLMVKSTLAMSADIVCNTFSLYCEDDKTEYSINGQNIALAMSETVQPLLTLCTKFSKGMDELIKVGNFSSKTALYLYTKEKHRASAKISSKKQDTIWDNYDTSAMDIKDKDGMKKLKSRLKDPTNYGISSPSKMLNDKVKRTKLSNLGESYEYEEKSADESNLELLAKRSKKIKKMNESTDSYDDLDEFDEAISLGEDSGSTTNDDADIDVSNGSDDTPPDDSLSDDGSDNAVTKAVKDKVSEVEEPADDEFGDDSSSEATTKEELLKKLSNITKSIEDTKKAVLDSMG